MTDTDERVSGFYLTCPICGLSELPASPAHIRAFVARMIEHVAGHDLREFYRSWDAVR